MDENISNKHEAGCSFEQAAHFLFACDLEKVQEKQNRDRQIGAQDLLTDRLIPIYRWTSLTGSC